MGERGRSQGHGHGHRKGTGAGSADQGASARERDPQQGQGDRGVGAGKGRKGMGKGAVGPRGQTGRGMGALGGGRSEGRGTGCGAHPQPDVQPVQCILPGIQRMPAHHSHDHHHHQAHLYNIDPDAGELIPPQPPQPQHEPAPPAPRADPARMAAASAGGGAGGGAGAAGTGAAGRAGARGRGDPALGPGLGHGPGRPDGWLSWACSGTTRGMRNRPFDAMLLRRYGGNREVPTGGWAGLEDHERVLRAVIRATWPDREPTWPAFLDGGAVLRITDADANNWLPPGLGQRPHPLALPPAEPATATAPTPTQAATQVMAQTAGAGEWEGDSAAGRPPRQSWAPRPTPPPHGTARRRGAPRLPWEGRRGQRARGGAYCPGAH